MNAIIISIGDELISGRTVDTNSAYLAGRLGEFGIFTLSHHTVGDEVDAVASAIRLAAARARIVLVTGGLGPTADDLTRQGLAMAMNSELVLNETCLAEIEEFFRRRGRRMVSANRIQAMIPVGGQAIPNRVGTAPGLPAKLGEAVIFVMPGVPQEMREMFDAFVLPRLPKSPGRIVQRLVHTCGMGESDVGEKISDLMQARGGNVIIGTTVATGMVSVRVTARDKDEQTARQQADRATDEIRNRLGTLVVGTDCDTIEPVVGRLLRQRGQTLATAESCTGGLLGKMITSVSGASEYYFGGVVCYADQIKGDMLGVTADTLINHGAVSEQVAVEMARGCRRRFASDWAVSLTGIAGPTGGSEEKPVGLVYIALAGPEAQEVYRHVLPGVRQQIRQRATIAAMNHLRLAMMQLRPKG